MSRPAVLKAADDTQVIAVDASTGQKVIKGGQTVDASLMDSIFACYTNMTQNPIAIFSMMILAFTMAAEYGNVDGPLEGLNIQLKTIANDPTEPSWFRSLASTVLKLTNLLITHKTKFITVGLMWVPYFSKPATKNLWASSIMSLMVLFMKQWDIMECFILSQAYYLYVCLRNPNHKFLVFFIAVLYFGFTLRMESNFNTSGLPTRTTAPPPMTTTKRN